MEKSPHGSSEIGHDPNFGGKEGGIADTFKKDLGSTSPEHLSKGHIYVSPSKTVAQSNANVVQNKKVSLATKKGGSIIHAQIPYQKFIKHFESLGWKDVGTSYYRMNTGTVLPMHSDLYVKYIDLFNLQGQEQK